MTINLNSEPQPYKILLKMQEMSKRIQSTNGFFTDIGDVNIGDVSFEDIKEFPSINIMESETTYNAPLPGRNDASLVSKEFDVLFSICLKGREDRQRKMSRLLADLEYLFLNNEVIPFAFCLEGLALSVNFMKAVAFTPEVGYDYYGYQLLVRTWFRQPVNDPTIKN